MFIECSKTDRLDLYKLLIGSVVPRPIAWVSSIGSNGTTNLAPFSFFNCFGVDPPMVGFAPGYKKISNDEKGDLVRIPKDTHRNVAATGEFVINIVSRAVAELMNATSGEFDASISEFESVGLTEVASQFVKPPRVGESLISFECKLIQIFQHGNNNLVLGEIVGIYADDSVLVGKLHVDPSRLGAIGRMAGNTYCTTDDRFDLRRPVI